LISNHNVSISEITALVRGDLDPFFRKKVKALRGIDDHVRHVILSLIQCDTQHSGQISRYDFIWLMQLSF
jgi:hypothetical protein